jgi:large exoprotein involved in heme utilization and adhesion
MNTIFSRIWNAHKGCWVACSEKAKACRKTGGINRSQLQLLTSISIISIPSAFALPTGGNITSGAGNIQIFDNGKQISVNQNSDKIIINWDKFGIKSDEKVRFNQPNQN